MARPTMTFTPRRVTCAVLSVFSITAFSALWLVHDGEARAASAAPPAYKVPPRPIASDQVVLQPGMSKKDWHDAYKEEGRPTFKQNTVKRVGGTVERD